MYTYENIFKRLLMSIYLKTKPQSGVEFFDKTMKTIVENGIFYRERRPVRCCARKRDLLSIGVRLLLKKFYKRHVVLVRKIAVTLYQYTYLSDKLDKCHQFIVCR